MGRRRCHEVRSACGCLSHGLWHVDQVETAPSLYRTNRALPTDASLDENSISHFTGGGGCSCAILVLRRPCTRQTIADVAHVYVCAMAVPHQAVSVSSKTGSLAFPSLHNPGNAAPRSPRTLCRCVRACVRTSIAFSPSHRRTPLLALLTLLGGASGPPERRGTRKKDREAREAEGHRSPCLCRANNRRGCISIHPAGGLIPTAVSEGAENQRLSKAPTAGDLA